jgi:hypothetical protein
MAGLGLSKSPLRTSHLTFDLSGRSPDLLIRALQELR